MPIEKNSITVLRERNTQIDKEIAKHLKEIDFCEQVQKKLEKEIKELTKQQQENSNQPKSKEMQYQNNYSFISSALNLLFKINPYPKNIAPNILNKTLSIS